MENTQEKVFHTQVKEYYQSSNESHQQITVVVTNVKTVQAFKTIQADFFGQNHYSAFRNQSESSINQNSQSQNEQVVTNSQYQSNQQLQNGEEENIGQQVLEAVQEQNHNPQQNTTEEQPRIDQEPKIEQEHNPQPAEEANASAPSSQLIIKCYDSPHFEPPLIKLRSLQSQSEYSLLNLPPLNYHSRTASNMSVAECYCPVPSQALPSEEAEGGVGCSSADCKRKSWLIEMQMVLGYKILQIRIVSNDKKGYVSKKIHYSIKITEDYIKDHLSFQNLIEKPSDILNYFHFRPTEFHFKSGVLTFKYQYFLIHQFDKKKQILKEFHIPLEKVTTQDIQQIKNEISDIMKANAQRDRIIKQSQTKIYNFTNSIQILRERIEKIYKEVSLEYKQEINKMKEHIESIQMQISKLPGFKAQLLQRMGKVNEEIRQFTIKISSYESRITTVTDQSTRNTKNIAILKEKVKTFDEKTREYSSTFQRINTKISALQTNFTLLTQKVHVLEEDVTKIKETSKTNTSEIRQLQKMKEFFNKEINKLTTRIIQFQKYRQQQQREFYANFENIYLGQHTKNSHKCFFDFECRTGTFARIKCILRGKSKEYYNFCNKYEIPILASSFRYKVTFNKMKGKIFVGCQTIDDLQGEGIQRSCLNYKSVYIGSNSKCYSSGTQGNSGIQFIQGQSVLFEIGRNQQAKAQWTKANKPEESYQINFSKNKNMSRNLVLSIIFTSPEDQVTIEILANEQKKL